LTIEYLKRSTPLILGLVFIFGSATEAQAYFDLGTSSMLIQILLASAIGFFFTTKTYLGKIKKFIKKATRKNSGDSPDS